ncbi:Diphthine methyltransferase [Cladochytrium tenue]|nr:Diphthine methyltransferase [Cladochytrium tenue]
MTAATFDTQLCADTCEFCPVAPTAARRVVAVGTYQVIATTAASAAADENLGSAAAAVASDLADSVAFDDRQLSSPEGASTVAEPAEVPRSTTIPRIGRVYLYRLDGGDRDDVVTPAATERFRLDTAAILDLKWSHHRVASDIMLASADALGCVRLYTLDEEECTLREKAVSSHEDPAVLRLSLDWANRVFPSREPSLAVSSSDGSAAVLRVDQSDGLIQVDSWPAHDFEAWVAAFDYWKENVVYTGKTLQQT